MHLIDAPGTALPSVEGILIGFDHVLSEYRVGVARLHWAPGGEPDALESRELRIHRGRVAFYEVL